MVETLNYGIVWVTLILSILLSETTEHFLGFSYNQDSLIVDESWFEKLERFKMTFDVISIDPYFKYSALCPTHNGTLSTYIRATIWKILLLFYVEKVSQLHISAGHLRRDPYSLFQIENKNFFLISPQMKV